LGEGNLGTPYYLHLPRLFPIPTLASMDLVPSVDIQSFAFDLHISVSI